MLEEGLLRQRDWEYATSAYAINDETRERLRAQVIEQNGEKLELIAPTPSQGK